MNSFFTLWIQIFAFIIIINLIPSISYPENKLRDKKSDINELTINKEEQDTLFSEDSGIDNFLKEETKPKLPEIKKLDSSKPSLPKIEDLLDETDPTKKKIPDQITNQDKSIKNINKDKSKNQLDLIIKKQNDLIENKVESNSKSYPIKESEINSNKDVNEKESNESIMNYVLMIIIIILLFVGLYFTTVGLNLFFISYIIKKTIPTSISNIFSDGYVKIKGMISNSKKTYETPLSNKKAVYYQIKLEKLSKGSPFKMLEKRIIEEKGEYIKVEDGSGVITIDIYRADIIFEETEENCSIWQEDIPKDVIEYINKKGNNIIKPNQNNDIKITEFYLSEGDPIYTIGQAKREPNNIQITRSGFSTLPFMVSNKDIIDVTLNFKSNGLIKSSIGILCLILAIFILYI